MQLAVAVVTTDTPYQKLTLLQGCWISSTLHFPKINRMNLHSNRIDENIYAITDGTGHIIYAPLAGVIVACEENDIQLLKSALRKDAKNNEIAELVRQLKMHEIELESYVTHPREFKKMSVLANYKCNLSCNYCYSAKGRSNKEISATYVDAAIDYFLGNASIGDRRSLFFSGGGEPLLSWDGIRPCLERAIKKANKHGVKLEIHFMSNGTIYSDEIASYMKTNNITLCFSYEILDSLQDAIRGKASVVENNLRKYLQNGNIVFISSTITPQSVTRLNEMVESVARRFPNLGTITLEPVTGSHLYGSPKKMDEFYILFDQNFEKASITAEKHHISLNTSAKDITNHFVTRYCPGKFCLTPEGTFTICHCASSPLEERYEKCNYGHIDKNGKIQFDLNKFKTLMTTGVNTYSECRDCFASAHCGGECMTRRDTYNSDFMASVCRHTRERVFTELNKALQNNG